MRVVPVPIVQENDRAGAEPPSHPRADLIGARASGVPHAKGPAEGAVAVWSDGTSHEWASVSVRRTEHAGDASGCRRDRLMGPPDLVRRPARTDPVQLHVGISVVT